MGKLIIRQERITDVKAFLDLCPFNALEINNGKVVINPACKMCKICVKKDKFGAISYIEEENQAYTKDYSDQWNGVAVYGETIEGNLHPVSLEMIGKARELADKTDQRVYVLLTGWKVHELADELLYYNVDRVFVYEHAELEHFRIEPYTAVFEDFIYRTKPSAILVGATIVGRQLAPRVAARFRTGLTADCTILDINDNKDLIQIRPAFGGNIMAEILTRHRRPQMATVRYKVMDSPKRSDRPKGNIIRTEIQVEKLKSAIKVLQIIPKPKEKMIEEADILIVAGRGIKAEKDLLMVEELAELLGGLTACTRPVIEAGWMDPRKQIGLSGRTVRPKLMITCGVSGSVQFIAGMCNSECIFAINRDPKAPIMKIANYSLAGDLYEILPGLIADIKHRKGVTAIE